MKKEGGGGGGGGDNSLSMSTQLRRLLECDHKDGQKPSQVVHNLGKTASLVLLSTAFPPPPPPPPPWHHQTSFQTESLPAQGNGDNTKKIRKLLRALEDSGRKANESVQIRKLRLVQTVLRLIVVHRYWGIFFRTASHFNTMKTWHFWYMLGYFAVPIIPLTLTWTTGSITCLCDIFACVYTRGTSVYSLIPKN